MKWIEFCTQCDKEHEGLGKPPGWIAVIAVDMPHPGYFCSWRCLALHARDMSHRSLESRASHREAWEAIHRSRRLGEGPPEGDASTPEERQGMGEPS